jgi:hypothetical protein
MERASERPRTHTQHAQHTRTHTYTRTIRKERRIRGLMIAPTHELARARWGLHTCVCARACVSVSVCVYRGLMIRAAHELTRAGGLILIALPRACLFNSRFCSQRILLGTCTCAHPRSHTRTHTHTHTHTNPPIHTLWTGQLKRLSLKALRVVNTARLSLLVLQVWG